MNVAHDADNDLAVGMLIEHLSKSPVWKESVVFIGLPPMSQYDAAATPMWRCFTAIPENKSFNALAADVNLNETTYLTCSLVRSYGKQ